MAISASFNPVHTHLRLRSHVTDRQINSDPNIFPKLGSSQSVAQSKPQTAQTAMDRLKAIGLVSPAMAEVCVCVGGGVSVGTEWPPAQQHKRIKNKRMRT